LNVVPDYPNRQTWKGLGQREAEGGKKAVRSRRRSSPYTTESAKINHRQKLKKLVLMMRIRNRWTRGTMSDI
jgi:hypothetical protein